MKIIKQTSSILDGWYHLFFKDKKVEPLAKSRAEICSKCINLNKKTYFCKLCYCYIPAKVRSRIEKCPIKKW